MWDEQIGDLYSLTFNPGKIDNSTMHAMLNTLHAIYIKKNIEYSHVYMSSMDY